MSYDHSLDGKIVIQPPLNRAEAEDPCWKDLWSLELDTITTVTVTDFERTVRVASDAIVPSDRGCGGGVAEELQTIVNALGSERTYTGFLEIRFEAGLMEAGEPGVERYYVRDGKVHTAVPELVWPEEVR